MKIFDSEANMQQWLSDRFAKGECLAEMIVNYEDFKKNALEAKPSMVLDKITSSFLYCLESFENNEVITENKDISFNPKDKLCPDFLLYAPETQSIIIIEIKNIKGPTRRTYLPFLSEGDIVNVIISGNWPTLLRHYAFNEIFWLQKKLICLEPVQTENGIQLSIIELSKITEAEVKPAVGIQQLGGYQLCLYDNELYQGGEYYRTEAYEDQMRTALQAMAIRGNTLKSHGFAFLWRHCFQVGLAPYNITIINIAAFQSLTRLFHDKAFKPNETTLRFIDILREHAPEGHGYALEDIKNYGQRFLTSFCSPQTEGFDSWENLKPGVFDQTDALAFVGWGIFGELFYDKLAEEYKNGFYDCDSTNPLLAITLLDEVISENYGVFDFNAFSGNENDLEDEPFRTTT